MVSIAWKVVDPATAGVVQDMRYFVVRPSGFAIPAAATAIHGITTERAAADGVPVQDVLAALQADIAEHNVRTVVAHHANFDVNIVRSEAARAGNDALFRKLAQPMKRFCTSKTNGYRKLAVLYEDLFGAPMTGCHDARADAEACCRIYLKNVVAGA